MKLPSILISNSKTLGLSLALGLTSCGTEVSPSADPATGTLAGRPIVLFLFDAYSAKHVSHLGYPLKTSPNLDALAAEGVHTSQVKRLPNRQAGLCFHECIDGMTSLIFYRRDSVATTLSPEDIDVETIRQAVALHVLGTTFQISESAMQTCLKAIRLAREAGIVVSFDPNIRNILGSTETDLAVEEALSTADLVMPTLDEAEAITGQSDPFRAARELRARGPQLVAVTLAGEGAVLLGEGEPILCPGYEVEMVEPTGAGDVHAAVLEPSHHRRDGQGDGSHGDVGRGQVDQERL